MDEQSKRRRKTYSEEFKRDAVAFKLTSGTPRSQLSLYPSQRILRLFVAIPEFFRTATSPPLRELLLHGTKIVPASLWDSGRTTLRATKNRAFPTNRRRSRC